MLQNGEKKNANGETFLPLGKIFDFLMKYTPLQPNRGQKWKYDFPTKYQFWIWVNGHFVENNYWCLEKFSN